MISKLTYDFDVDHLNKLYENNLDLVKPFVEMNGNTIEHFYILKIKDKYLDQLIEQIGYEARPRFLLMKKGCTLPYHKDAGTLSAINILLKGDDPIHIEGSDYHYEMALIDVQKQHTVNVTNDRLIFKFSYFDVDYETLKTRLSKINWIS